jgi:hypothetical protein
MKEFNNRVNFYKVRCCLCKNMLKLAISIVFSKKHLLIFLGLIFLQILKYVGNCFNTSIFDLKTKKNCEFVIKNDNLKKYNIYKYLCDTCKKNNNLFCPQCSVKYKELELRNFNESLLQRLTNVSSIMHYLLNVWYPLNIFIYELIKEYKEVKKNYEPYFSLDKFSFVFFKIVNNLLIFFFYTFFNTINYFLDIFISYFYLKTYINFSSNLFLLNHFSYLKIYYSVYVLTALFLHILELYFDNSSFLDILRICLFCIFYKLCKQNVFYVIQYSSIKYTINSFKGYQQYKNVLNELTFKIFLINDSNK